MTIPLQHAYLCPNCNCIGSNPMQCDCGNAYSLLALEPVLNRVVPDRTLVIDSTTGMHLAGNVQVDWMRQ